MVRKSTFIITICILLVVFISIISIIVYHYETKKINVNIPTVVEEESNVQFILPGIITE